MKKITYFLAMTITLGALSSCNNENKPEKEVETEPLVFRKDGNVRLLKANGSLIKQLDVEVADDDYERETGLMYRESMETDQGMLFLFPNEEIRYFYMKNTLIPLDIIYFDRDSTLISFQENAIPMDQNSLPSEGPAKFVLEVNAGLVEAWSLQKGDTFSFEATAE